MKVKSSRYWDRALSLVDGCTHAGSIGCDHCWSMAMNKRFGKWPEKVTPRPDRLDIPLKTKKPTVFALWNDLFHEDVSLGFICDVFDVIDRCSQHTFLILTKRAQRMLTAWDYLGMSDDAPSLNNFQFDNIWSGLTVCNQPELDSKMSYFLRVPGHKWLSIEPMLGPIDLTDYLVNEHLGPDPYESQEEFYQRLNERINAVVVGCETGPHRRPCKLDWIRSIVEQCKTAGVSVFVKQIEINGKVVYELEQFPEDLRVRDLPWRVK